MIESLPGVSVEGHMARTKAALPAGSRITDYISLGVIAKFVPAVVVINSRCARNEHVTNTGTSRYRIG